jgi:hypothetical protein
MTPREKALEEALREMSKVVANNLTCWCERLKKYPAECAFCYVIRQADKALLALPAEPAPTLNPGYPPQPNGCDCYWKAPTVPTCRPADVHLPGCAVRTKGGGEVRYHPPLAQCSRRAGGLYCVLPEGHDADGSPAPMCFHPPACDIAPEVRAPCGIQGLASGGCGCRACWDTLRKMDEAAAWVGRPAPSSVGTEK